MSIGSAIKEYRLSQGMTQLDLAIRINKSTRTVMRYEKNEITPKIDVLETIFNDSIYEIFNKYLFSN